MAERDAPRTVPLLREYLSTRLAKQYTGRSRTTINRAVATGALRVYGRPGGERGERVFERAELDRWLRGPVAETPCPRHDPYARSARTPVGADALARIKRAAAGGRP